MKPMVPSSNSVGVMVYVKPTETLLSLRSSTLLMP